MKLYHVDQGTPGILIKNLPNGKSEQSDWTVRKDITFGDHELAVDPIRLHNNPDMTLPAHIGNLVLNGYAIFTAENQLKYSLAVKYSDVVVI